MTISYYMQQRQQSKRQQRPIARTTSTMTSTSTSLFSTLTILLLNLLLSYPPSTNAQQEQAAAATTTNTTPNDPDNLCRGLTTGYKPTLDCRGYVYCNAGFVMGGGSSATNPAGISGGSGVIACWPNQLFDVGTMGCTYWQNVNVEGGNCPSFDGGMMMPEDRDENANEKRFFCGVSASNAKRVCEACPGGSRLECSDPTHNCFAGITGCPINSKPSGGSGGGTLSSLPKPSTSTTTTAAQAVNNEGENWIPADSVSSTNNIPPPTNLPTPKPSTRQPTKMPTLQPVTPAVTPKPVITWLDQSPPTTATTSNNNALVSSPTTVTANVVSSPSNNNNNNNNSNNNNNAAGVTTANVISTDTSSYYCGYSWNTVISNCKMAQPCPGGLNTDCRIAGQMCFPDTPCANTKDQDKEVVAAPIITVEMQTYYCGWDWDWVVGNCNKAIPCPYGDASGVCPSGMKCIADTPCWAINNGMPTPKPTPIPTQKSYPPVKSDNTLNRYCGYDWDWVTNNCNKSTPCPTGDAKYCPSGMKCIAETPCFAINNGAPTPKPSRFPTKEPTFPPVKGDDPAKRFCGHDWTDVTDNCLYAIPCPGGVAEGVCPYQMKCIAETPCSDQTYLDWIRDKEASNGSGQQQQQQQGISPISQPTPSNAVVAPPPTPKPVVPAVQSSNQGSSSVARCTSNADCEKGHFCNQPDPREGGYCGECISPGHFGKGGMGCLDDYCRASGCYSQDVLGPTKCYKPWELDNDCMAQLNDLSAKCNLQRLVCEGQQKQTAQKEDVDTTTMLSTVDKGVVTSNSGEGSNMSTGSSMTIHENPAGNQFFCGPSFAGITERCLEMKPCPGGKASDYCESNEGCFANLACQALYESATVVSSLPSSPQSLPTNPPNQNAQLNESTQQIGPTQNIPASIISTPEPSLKPTQSDALPTTPFPSKSPVVNTNFCGTSWADHTQKCDESIPCPDGVCPMGLNCFSGSPCANSNGSAGVVGNSNVGNFCGTAWNVLVNTCQSATRCSGDGDCAQGEICYRDFVCEPRPTMNPTVTKSSQPTKIPVVSSSIESAPMTLAPSTAPIVNLNYCGTSWEEHIKNCGDSTPCPDGVCPLGQQCFNGSPCANSDAIVNSNVGNFCGTEWNLLMNTCKAATRCNSDGDCAQGEICYRDFVCSPKPTSTPTLTSAPTIYNPLAALLVTTPTTQKPTTLSPTKSPTANTDFCGKTWEDHIQNCESSLPCPNGQFECPVGQSCFSGSPCADTDASQEEDSVNINLGSFCGTSWNKLLTTCETATKCPNGNECADNEFCYRDFVCNPPVIQPGSSNESSAALGPTSTGSNNALSSSSGSNPADSGSNEDSLANVLGGQIHPSSSTTGHTAAVSEQQQGDPCNVCGNSQVDWSKNVDYEGSNISCGEFGWMLSADGVYEGSDQCLNLRGQFFGDCCYAKPTGFGCDLCDTGINGLWHDIRDGENVLFDGENLGCLDLSNKIRNRFEPTNEECIATKNEHFDDCCFEKCSLCGDSNLDWDASVIFSGQEVLCHELDSKIFVEQGISADSSRCEMSRSFYSKACCIVPPVQPCNMCTFNSLHFNMDSVKKVSHDGSVTTCLEVYHSLYARHEQTSGHCLDVQNKLFDQCCVAVEGISSTAGEGIKPTNRPTSKPSQDFNSWYTTGEIRSRSPASLTMASRVSIYLTIGISMMMLVS